MIWENVKLIKKWINMIVGKSILHAKQSKGKIYSKDKVLGYYNDMSNKVLQCKTLDEYGIPFNVIDTGEKVYFPIAIFQYGLGAYDLYLLNDNEEYLEKFKKCVEWALKMQMSNGAWNTFGCVNATNPYSAMSQGEGASLLLRAYLEFNNDDYLIAAKNAIDFMLKSVAEGGTTIYDRDDLYLKEFIDKPVVLNGWIFAIFGLYDYCKVSNDDRYATILNRTLNTLAKEIKNFDNGYWSKYDIEEKLTSPFYHHLHIAQLDVLYELFKIDVFLQYSLKWRYYTKKYINKIKAFIVKAFQKVSEKRNSEARFVS